MTRVLTIIQDFLQFFIGTLSVFTNQTLSDFMYLSMKKVHQFSIFPRWHTIDIENKKRNIILLIINASICLLTEILITVGVEKINSFIQKSRMLNGPVQPRDKVIK